MKERETMKSKQPLPAAGMPPAAEPLFEARPIDCTRNNLRRQFAAR